MIRPNYLANCLNFFPGVCGCCIAASPEIYDDFFGHRGARLVLLGVLRKTLPKAMVRSKRSFGAVRNVLADDGNFKMLRRHDTEWRADDGGHDGHLADVEQPRQPCAAAR